MLNCVLVGRYGGIDWGREREDDSRRRIQNAHYRRLLDDVAKGAYSIVITKRGKPVARVEAIRPQAEQGPLKGRWAGLGKTKGDIFYFDSSAEWEALR